MSMEVSLESEQLEDLIKLLFFLDYLYDCKILIRFIGLNYFELLLYFKIKNLLSITTGWLGGVGTAGVGLITWNAKGKFSVGIVGVATLVIAENDCGGVTAIVGNCSVAFFP